MIGHERSHQFEMDATVNRVGEVRFDTAAPFVGGVQGDESRRLQL
jgi:hypothetical protein